VCPNIVVTSVLILDDSVTSSASGGANAADCVDDSTTHSVTESSSCVRQDERSQAIAPEQEDDGRSGGSRDSASGNKGSNRARFINNSYFGTCSACKVSDSDKYIFFFNIGCLQQYPAVSSKHEIDPKYC
jgi:hypothetical protein